MLWYGTSRLYALINLEADRMRPIMNAVDALTGDAAVLDFEDFDVGDLSEAESVVNPYPDAMVIPEHMWKHLTSGVIDRLHDGTEFVFVHFSPEQFALLSMFRLNIDTMRAVADVAYLAFEIDLHLDEEIELRTVQLPVATLRCICTNGTGGLEHGLNLNDIRIQTSGDSAGEDADDDEDELIPCRECEGMFEPDELDDELCESCRVFCDRCSSARTQDELEDGYCEDCRDNYMSRCEGCGTWHSDDDLDDGYCENCEAPEECEHCGNTFPADELNASGRCENCEANFRPCAECGDETHVDSLDWNNRCEDCAAEFDTCSECGGEFNVNDLNIDNLCESCSEMMAEEENA